MSGRTKGRSWTGEAWKASFNLGGGVPDGTRTHNSWIHSPVLCQLSYRHHALEAWVSVSRVLFLRPSISAHRGLAASSPQRLLSPSGLDEQCHRPHRRLLRGGLPFSLRPQGAALVSVALVPTHQRGRRSGLSGPLAALPRLDAGHPALRSSDFPLDAPASSGRTSAQASPRGGQAPSRVAC